VLERRPFWGITAGRRIAETSSDGPHVAQANSRLGFVVLLLLCVITWSLSHSYRGIFHDANLYVLQALAHL
jgi:hypothetical protein